MKIVHLCSMDHGGAGKAVMRLHDGFVKAGYDSLVLVMTKKGADASVKVVPPDSALMMARPALDVFENDKERWDKYCQHLGSLLAPYPNRSSQLEIFTDADAHSCLSGVKEIQQADVIILHWVAGMLDYAEFNAAFGGKKVIWTFHDMSAFTGGCHYTNGCVKYRTGCGACPQLGSDSDNDISRQIWIKKKNCLHDAVFSVVTPSRWLAKCAESSPILWGKKITHIPNSLPLEIFRPYSKSEVRIQTNIGVDEKIILFGADSLVNPRKGFTFLRDAINCFKNKYLSDVTVVCFGSIPERFDPKLNCRLISTGFIDDEIQLAKVYSLADVYVIPSIEDNLPNTALEAMACGLPIAGFRIGGMPDIVEQGVTGHLAEAGNPDSLADSIAWCLEYGGAIGVKYACREKAENTYSPKQQIPAYLALIGGHNPVPLQPESSINVMPSREDLMVDLSETERTFACNPSNKKAFLKLVSLYNSQGRYDEAFEAFKKHDSLTAQADRTLLKIKEEIATIEWFHRIDLGNGIVTPGRDDSNYKLQHIGLPENLEGKAVLDIGTWDGFFSFTSEKRGAKKVVSADIAIQPGYKVAKRILNSQAVPIEIDVMDLTPENVGTFDLVLCLGVLYHLKHPLMALERIFSVTADQLILETYVDMLDCDRPAMAFYPGTELNGDASNWSGPNPAMVIAMLKTAGFRKTEMYSNTLTGGYATNRAVFHAWR